MLIDGFEKFQKNFELSDEEIDTLKITFIKEIFANSKFFLLVFHSEDVLEQCDLLNFRVTVRPLVSRGTIVLRQMKRRYSL